MLKHWCDPSYLVFEGAFAALAYEVTITMEYIVKTPARVHIYRS